MVEKDLFSCCRILVAAQHSVHPTGGTLRVFKHFARLEVDSGKMVFSHPSHQWVTLTVGRQVKQHCYLDSSQFYK